MSRRPLWCLFPIWLLVASFPFAAEVKTRVDGYGDPLPAHALGRLGTVRLRHGAKIDCLAFSPDGKYLVSASNDRKLILWEAPTGRKIRVLGEDPGNVRVLAVSPDGKFLASASGDGPEDKGHLRIWNVSTGELMVPPLETEKPIFALAYSPDGKTLASADRFSGLRLWDTRKGKLNHSLANSIGENNLSSFCFRPDGKTLVVTGPGNTIRFGDLSTGKVIQRELKDARNVHTLAFSPDGNILALAREDGIRLYAAATLTELRRLEGSKERSLLLAFAAGGKTLLSHEADRTIRLWNVASGKQLPELPTQNEGVRTIAVSPDGNMVATAHAWDDHRIHLYDVATRTEMCAPLLPLANLNQVAFLRDGETVATRSDGRDVVVWSKGLGTTSKAMPLPEGLKSCVLGSGRSTLGAITTNNTVLVQDIPSGRELVRCSLARKSRRLALSPDNKHAAVELEGWGVEVWDLRKNKLLHNFPTEGHCLGFSRSGRMLALGSNTRQILVWDLDMETYAGDGIVPDQSVCHLIFSPDDRMVVTEGKNGSIILWEIATGKKRQELRGHLDHVYALALSPDGSLLASGSGDQTVRLWDRKEGKELQVFAGHLNSVYTVDFSPDGRRLVSGSGDMTALIWEIPAALRNRKAGEARLDKQDQYKLWTNLANTDAAVAYAALQRLAAAPAEAVVLCQAGLFNSLASAKQIQRWIEQLDDEEYAIREQASNNLEFAEERALPDLQSKVKGECSPEVRRRIELLLEMQREKHFHLRIHRVVELLEQIGTAEAVDVLRQLEKKTGDAAVRDDVRRSLGRLTSKQKTP